MSPRVRRLFVLVPLFAATLANAWFDVGHMVVADIAYEHMTPTARKEADRLLAFGGTDRTRDFVTASCWADDIKRDRPETSKWHYIDLHFRSDGKPTANKPDDENVVWAIHKFEAVLGNKSAPDADRAEALRFIIHFVGDLHQPLHAVSRDTDSLPDGDAGGNKFTIQPPASYQGISRPPHNLHALWDGGLGLFVFPDVVHRPLGAEDRTHVDAIAHNLEQEHPEASLKDVHNLDPQKWAEESLAASKATVYNLQEGTAPSQEYVAAGQAVASVRVALAGYRLAQVLNKLLQ